MTFDPRFVVPPRRRVRARANGARATVQALSLLAAAWLCAAPQGARAETYDVLAECMALTTDEDEIHGCLDNYLDVMDDNIDDLEAFLRRELDGEALAGFERSQSAFASYRRENCLWYLGFNSPRAQAEKIAKNCLARMSLDRLAELQSLLVRDEGANRAIDGFYVYGANRNSFRPCGANTRYWVEGDAAAVGALQDGYDGLATADLQVMFASVTGGIEEGADAPVDHDGVLRVRSVQDVRVPSDGDCRLPDGSPPVTSVATVGEDSAPSVEQRVADTPERDADASDTDTADDRTAIASAPESSDAAGDAGDAGDGEVAEVAAAPATGAATAAVADRPDADGWIGYSGGEATEGAGGADANPVADPDSLPEPPAVPLSDPPDRSVAGRAPGTVSPLSVVPGEGERLTAYFGAWLADCEAGAQARRCRVAVDLDEGDAVPELALLRGDGGATSVEVAFPDRAVAAAEAVDWAIDGYAFGGSGGGSGGGEVAANGRGTVLRLDDRRFVDELLPRMRRGSTLVLDVRARDGSTERLDGTLIGLTRALRFADSFLAEGGS